MKAPYASYQAMWMMAGKRSGSGQPPFDPSTITGLKLWLKVDSLALTDGALVTAWIDSSGSGNSVAAAGGQEPIFRLTGGAAGKPCVQFDGTDDALVKAAFAGGAIAQPDTAIIVYDVGVPSAWSSYQAFGIGVSGNLAANAGSTLDTGVLGVANIFHVQSTIFNGASSTIYVDGILKATGNAGANGAAGIIMFANGSGANFAGKLCELLIYNSALSSTDRGNVESYLRTKYGTP